MGKLYQFPRDVSAPVIVAHMFNQRFFIAQLNGSLCPHYHTYLRTAERCHRSLARAARGMRLAQ